NSKDATEEEERERRDQVQVPDGFVVGRRHPPDNERTLARRCLRLLTVDTGFSCRRAHLLVSLLDFLEVGRLVGLARGRSVLLLPLGPLVELVLGHDLYVEEHAAVVHPAQLGTTTDVVPLGASGDVRLEGVVTAR